MGKAFLLMGPPGVARMLSELRMPPSRKHEVLGDLSRRS
jgi:hypothetical protein